MRWRTCEGAGPPSENRRLHHGFRLGVACLIIAACCAADLSRPIGLALIAGIVIASLALARVPVRTLAMRLWPIAAFCMVAFALVLIVPTDPDECAGRVVVLGRPISQQGVTFVGALATKSLLVLLFATAVAAVSTERDLLVGLTELRLPSKVVSLLYLTVSGLRCVGDEVRRLMRGRDARGRPSGVRAICVAAAMTQVLMVRLCRRAEVQAMAMVARGFTDRLPVLGCSPITRRQGLLLILVGLTLAAMTRL